MQELLQTLRAHNFEIHAFTNYPYGKRKPDPEFYLKVVEHLGVESCDCLFIDDRPSNVKCAVEIGMRGLCFENADSFLKDFSNLGINQNLQLTQED
ncbi:unnamed protein product [Eruca vesicaria subsp. sativa]|uniref:Uncharacterized protein n=1 Tax=Eruca vesicaria subsp. sativa TaxID=29727 RepID=A0ABC8M828_ERUVS|nr:unnamed protein product [Eruca vesicaria subsp. sativa]